MQAGDEAGQDNEYHSQLHFESRRYVSRRAFGSESRKDESWILYRRAPGSGEHPAVRAFRDMRRQLPDGEHSIRRAFPTWRARPRLELRPISNCSRTLGVRNEIDGRDYQEAIYGAPVLRRQW